MIKHQPTQRLFASAASTLKANRIWRIYAALGLIGSALTAPGAIVVNDTWRDGTRTDPAQPTYSENGTDTDADGNLEALWYNTGGAMTVVNATPGVTPGLLRTTVPAAGSASWTTYFTPEASPVTLVNAGDTITITWIFTPTAPISTDANNASMRIAIVDTPAAARRTTDGAPGSAAYRGYGIFGNFAQTLGASPLRLMERVNPTGNFLSTSGEYSLRAAAGTAGNAGYTQGATYTLVFSATRTAASELNITATISGGSIDGTGSVSVNYLDTTPDTFTFDTFGMRPNTGAATSEQFDTSLFKVELTAGCPPGTLFSVTGGGAYCSGDNGVSIGLAGSEPNVDYQLKLGSTDVGSPNAGTGAALNFGLQTTAGTYTIIGSNTLTGCVGPMTSNAVVTINTPPNIGTQPTAQNPALGGSTSFTVSASGAGLTYQWRRDGTNLNNGGSISGATSATLTVNPVALTDGVDAANGYDVVISGTCSPATTSDRVAMAVAIPKNLTWVGDGIANLWDTTTLNWTGEASTFSANDNVTFNNSGSAVPAVDLGGGISPNAVTVTGSQNYTIGTTTAGSIGGIATLTKSGSGTLTLTTVNTFTGKATVNGGTLSIAGVDNLGATPAVFTADQLTLNGGSIEITASGSSAANRGTTLGASGGTFNIPTGVDFVNTPITAGPGSLTKIGAGSLALSVANTYAGGTVISNGIVIVGNASGLGTGAATLAGGTLSFPTAQTIANNVQVVADSTLTFATTGNSAVILNGNLTGTSGQTLTITPTASTTAATRVRVNNGLTNSFTFDANLVLNGTFTFATYNNVGDQIYNGVISGAGIMGRRSPLAGTAGRTILNGDNTYSGGTAIADGAIGFGLDSTGTPVTSGPIGTGALLLENNPGTLHRLFASGGARTVGNAITWPATVNQDLTIEGSNALTLNGDMDLGGSPRTIVANNSATTTFGGVIGNGGLTKIGPGVLLLNGVNTYVGTTTVSNGTLGGLGTIAGPVVVESPGSLAPGTVGIGTLTVTGDLTLNGNTAVDINASTTGSDLVTSIATANYGGTLTVNNLAGTLAVGQSYTLFSATTHNGSFASFSPATPGAGLSWSFANGVLSVISSAAPPTLAVSQSGNTLTFSWTGAFKLQAQTNSLSVGLANNWGDYPGGNTSPVNAPIDQASGSVFFRLINQ